MANKFNLSYTAEEIDEKLGEIDNLSTTVDEMDTAIDTLTESKQDKLTGAVDQVVSFDEQGNVITISAITIDEIDAICNGVSILSAEAVHY